MKGSVDLNVECGVINSALPRGSGLGLLLLSGWRAMRWPQLRSQMPASATVALVGAAASLGEAGTASEMKKWLSLWCSRRGSCLATDFCGVGISHLRTGKGWSWHCSNLQSSLYMQGGSV